ncbi:hypothetical protein IFM89_027316 [Coptis chinensis]|uniref:Endonuclease/exonuclease/phosphatase domain-containing protein n=1 Tax=Coptis chinensis TaxID=261450 RepID=A0A835HTG0_9MAGN|nr:hypothetical protein IFM89_027316 [Coptis chinensis]
MTIECNGSIDTIVHASTLYMQQRSLWQELAHLNPLNISWLIMGDFNAYLSPSEKKSSLRPTSASMEEFRDTVNMNQLIEAPTGYMLTLTNNQKIHRRIRGWYDRIPKPTNAPFRFFNMWTSHPDFLEVVKENWKVPIEGHSLFILSQKLKKLKQKLKHWNKYVFGNLGTKITEATHNLEALQH